MVVAALAFAGCGDTGDVAPTRSAVKLTAPAALVHPGALTFCSDIGYPPMEFDDAGTPNGADIAIGRRLGRLMGVKVRFAGTPFDDIIPAVRANTCDAAISSLTNTAERAQLVNFVDYLEVGQSLMVQTSNPHGIKRLDDLAGMRVAVQAGTTNEDFLRQRAKGDEDPPVIRAFEKDTDATEALKRGDVDAYFGDSPVVAYHIGREALTYAFAGKPINPEPIGIAVAPDAHELHAELQRGIDAMYADGSMAKILARWKLDDFALDG
jgi:polar amino acid transport system substrate-binding protein